MCHCFYLALNRQKVAQNKDKIGQFLLHLERSHPTCSHYETSHLVDEASVSSLLKHLCCLRHSWNNTISVNVIIDHFGPKQVCQLKVTSENDPSHSVPSLTVAESLHHI